jgi:hypothetical protein
VRDTTPCGIPVRMCACVRSCRCQCDSTEPSCVGRALGCQLGWRASSRKKVGSVGVRRQPSFRIHANASTCRAGVHECDRIRVHTIHRRLSCLGPCRRTKGFWIGAGADPQA